MAKQLTDPSKNQYGVYVWNQWEYGYFPLMYSNGARFTNEGFTKTAFNTPEAAAALQWYIDLIYKEKCRRPRMWPIYLASRVGDLFATGKIAMSPKNYSFDALNQQIGDRFEWGRYRAADPTAHRFAQARTKAWNRLWLPRKRRPAAHRCSLGVCDVPRQR